MNDAINTPMAGVERNLRKARRLSVVPRWVIVPTLRKQTVDQHSYQTAQIARWLMHFHVDAGLDAGFELAVIEYCLDHDQDEAITGDEPSTSKPPTDPVTQTQVQVVVKCADILEAICFMEEEAAMGNALYASAILAERRAAFHDWWQAFDWNETNNRKPLSSDIIKRLVSQFVNPIHPALEGRV